MTKAPREWQDFTQKAMELAGLSQSELARILTKKTNKQTAQSQIHMRVLHPDGRAPQDEKELATWADALKLDGYHRETFIRLALFERTPTRIRKQLCQVEEQAARHEKALKNAERQMNELRATIVRLSNELAENATQTAVLVQRLSNQSL